MQILETIIIALNSLRNNKLRSLLTILGIVVGIFSIICISTIISVLQNSIESGVSQLGKNTFQIQKFPAMHEHGDRDKYRNRKDLDLDEYYLLKERLTEALYVGAEQWDFGATAKYRNEETNPNISVSGITPDAQPNNKWNVEDGRAINNSDVDHYKTVCVLGQDVVKKLFHFVDPIGQTIKVNDKRLTVIGVYEAQGAMFGQSQDNYVVLPITTFQTLYGKHRRSINITVMAPSKEAYNSTIESAIGHMRIIRKVPASEDNDFEIFSNESVLEQINNTTKYVEIGAMVIAMIALIAAGVGIMNIMLVSVTERTKEIGIRKAIGAKKIVILFQFLTEAVVLSIVGGIIGIVLGVSIGNLAGLWLEAKPVIPVFSVLLGVFLCVIVGVVFGTYPAYKAANLDPIEALRYE